MLTRAQRGRHQQLCDGQGIDAASGYNPGLLQSPKTVSRFPILPRLRQCMPALPTRLLFLVMLFAVLLRLWFFVRFQELEPDSIIYGDIAKNWLLHGVYGMTPQGVLTPTLIRLPGYPAFLAVIFS